MHYLANCILSFCHNSLQYELETTSSPKVSEKWFGVAFLDNSNLGLAERKPSSATIRFSLWGSQRVIIWLDDANVVSGYFNMKHISTDTLYVALKNDRWKGQNQKRWCDSVFFFALWLEAVGVFRRCLTRWTILIKPATDYLNQSLAWWFFPISFVQHRKKSSSLQKLEQYRHSHSGCSLPEQGLNWVMLSGSRCLHES